MALRLVQSVDEQRLLQPKPTGMDAVWAAWARILAKFMHSQPEGTWALVQALLVDQHHQCVQALWRHRVRMQ